MPFALDSAGLPLRTSIDVVVFAIAAMGLNVLVGHTGLVSFGHGAWFGLGAYAAALSQRYWFPDAIVLPALFTILFVGIAALLSGALILRRRGVYFSLLTLALTAVALHHRVSLDGLHRRRERPRRHRAAGGAGRRSRTRPRSTTAVAAVVSFLVVILLWRFHRSPVGSVLVAIRENEERARSIGYSSSRYKLLGFVVSAVVVGVAGVLSVFNHRFASAEPIAVAFSGELLAMVVIGGMRSFLGPALGALFFILFREFLSIWTPYWLFYFGLLFVSFVMFSPLGLVGVAGRLMAPFRPRIVEEAAMAARRTATPAPLPEFLRPRAHVTGPILVARGISKRFGGIKAVEHLDLSVDDRTLHALIGPNGAGKTTAFNVLSGLVQPDSGDVMLASRSIAGLTPAQVCAAGLGRSFQITNLFPALTSRRI